MSKKIIKNIGFGIIILILIGVAIFSYNCMDKSYNYKVLSKLNGEILYTERDTDLTIKIYKSKANLDNKEFVYAYKESNIENDNIIDMNYDKNLKVITFVAYDNNYKDWMQFELDVNGKVTPLNIAYNPSIDSYEDGIIYKDYIYKNIKGNLYMINSKTKEEILLKKYIGVYDDKFTGYTPIKVSDDGKFLFYIGNKHITPIGAILEGIIFGDSVFETYVMDLETKEISKFVDFNQIIFLNE